MADLLQNKQQEKSDEPHEARAELPEEKAATDNVCRMRAISWMQVMLCPPRRKKLSLRETDLWRAPNTSAVADPSECEREGGPARLAGRRYLQFYGGPFRPSRRYIFDGDADRESLSDACDQLDAGDAVPSEAEEVVVAMVQLSQIPVNVNGKADLRALPAVDISNSTEVRSEMLTESRCRMRAISWMQVMLCPPRRKKLSLRETDPEGTASPASN
jgi:hypothetical protein